MTLRLLLITLVLGPVASVLTSCASSKAAKTESILAAAGFKVRTPENAKQQAIYDQLPDYKIQRGTHEGKTFYAFKNKKEGVAYIGGPKEFERYREITVQQDIAREQRIASEMQRDMSDRWWDAYHPYYHPYF